MVFDSGNIYEGQWENDKMIGYGKFTVVNNLVQLHSSSKYVINTITYQGDAFPWEKTDCGYRTLITVVTLGEPTQIISPANL